MTNEQLQIFTKLALALKASGLSGFDKENETLIKIIYGTELGLKPIQAAHSVQTVQGKIVLSAQAMLALARGNIECEYIQCKETSEEKAVLEGKRKGDPEPTIITYTYEQAVEAGLTAKSVWKKHRAEMLRSRATTNLVRLMFPESVLGIYSDDEIGTPKDASPSPIPETDLPKPNVSRETMVEQEDRYKFKEEGLFEEMCRQYSRVNLDEVADLENSLKIAVKKYKFKLTQEQQAFVKSIKKERMNFLKNKDADTLNLYSERYPIVYFDNVMGYFQPLFEEEDYNETELKKDLNSLLDKGLIDITTLELVQNEFLTRLVWKEMLQHTT